MRSRFVGAAACGLALALADVHLRQSLVPSAAAEARPLARAIKSGYAIGDEQCGQAPLAFSKLRIGMRVGYCAGLVASKDDGLRFPRSIVQVPDTRFFVVADMGSWGERQGRFLLLDPEAADGQRLKVLLTRQDLPHGLAAGPDRRIYASTAETIFRFDPLAPQPDTTVEVIVRGLPGRRTTLSDGTTISNNLHPLKHFVFDSTGRIHVNIGAPSDNCTRTPASRACAAGEGPAPLAALWTFTPPAGGLFPALRPGDANPPREIYARGLRNSMALGPHPQFPTAGYAFLQGENARDLPDAMKPNEEINALEQGKHYGWPYCYDLTTVSPEYRSFVQTSTQYRNLCRNAALYKPPHSVMPPHGAPLAMFYYQGSKFPELAGKLVVGLHGYRPTGSRVVFYDVDAHGFPTISPAPVTFRVSCAAQPTQTFATEPEGQVPAARFTELIADWHKVNGVRPQGAPVGMTVAADGAIWLVEDKNQTIVRIDVDPTTTAADPLGCDSRTDEQVKELADLAAKDRENAARLSRVRAGVIEKHCVGCHSDFDLKPGMSDAQKDAAVLTFLLRQDGWIYPGDPEGGRLHSRVRGKGAEKIMPANGAELIAREPGYRQLLDTLDQFVARMVPGERQRIAKSPNARLRNRGDKICGAVPNKTLVVVVDKRPREKPGYARIFRPADQHLNGECADGDGYYVANADLGAL
jgi:glucose/arabinose dehydrogenase